MSTDQTTKQQQIVDLLQYSDLNKIPLLNKDNLSELQIRWNIFVKKQKKPLQKKEEKKGENSSKLEQEEAEEKPQKKEEEQAAKKSSEAEEKAKQQEEEEQNFQKNFDSIKDFITRNQVASQKLIFIIGGIGTYCETAHEEIGQVLSLFNYTQELDLQVQMESGFDEKKMNDILSSLQNYKNVQKLDLEIGFDNLLKKTHYEQFLRITKQRNLKTFRLQVQNGNEICENLVSEALANKQLEELKINLGEYVQLDLSKLSLAPSEFSTGIQNLSLVFQGLNFENSSQDSLKSLQASLSQLISNQSNLLNLQLYLGQDNEFSKELLENTFNNQGKITDLEIIIKSGNEFKDNQKLLENFGQLKSLRKLNIKFGIFQNLDDQGAEALMKSLQNASELEEIQINIAYQANLSINGVISLANILYNHSKLKTYNLFIKKINNLFENMQLLSEYLKRQSDSSKVTQLETFNFQIDDQNIDSMEIQEHVKTMNLLLELSRLSIKQHNFQFGQKIQLIKNTSAKEALFKYPQLESNQEFVQAYFDFIGNCSKQEIENFQSDLIVYNEKAELKEFKFKTFYAKFEDIQEIKEQDLLSLFSQKCKILQQYESGMIEMVYGKKVKLVKKLFEDKNAYIEIQLGQLTDQKNDKAPLEQILKLLDQEEDSLRYLALMFNDGSYKPQRDLMKQIAKKLLRMTNLLHVNYFVHSQDNGGMFGGGGQQNVQNHTVYTKVMAVVKEFFDKKQFKQMAYLKLFQHINEKQSVGSSTLKQLGEIMGSISYQFQDNQLQQQGQNIINQYPRYNQFGGYNNAGDNFTNPQLVNLLEKNLQKDSKVKNYFDEEGDIETKYANIYVQKE